MAITIDGKTYRNQQEQIAYLTEQVEELKKIIKKVYRTTESLNSSSTTVLRNTTNCPEEEKSGWLLDSNANLYSINDNNGTNLLILYYTNVGA